MTVKKTILTALALLLTAAQGAWAEEQVDISHAIIYNPYRFLVMSNPTTVFDDDFEHFEKFVEVYAYVEGEGWKELCGGDDFTVSYKDSDGYPNAYIDEYGSFIMTITGIGRYKGEVSQTLYILEGGNSWDQYQAASFSHVDTENRVVYIESEEEMALLISQFNHVYNIPYYGWTFRLTRDLDLSAHYWVPIGSAEAGSEAQFVGHFDGQGHTIKGIHFERGNTEQGGNQGLFYPQGLFALASNSSAVSSIKNLTISESEIVGKNNLGVGAVVGYLNSQSTVENCHVTSSVNVVCSHGQGDSYSGDSYGGIVGHCHNGNIRGCTSAAHVFKLYDRGTCQGFGGIVGACEIEWDAKYGALTDCIYYGDQVFADSETGAIVGRLGNKLNKTIHCYYTSSTLKGCNGSDPIATSHVAAFDMFDGMDVTTGGEATKMYDYNGVRVYPNAMMFGNLCFTDPQYVTVSLYDNAANTIHPTSEPCKVVLQGRTLYRDGSWNTLCLPFSTLIEGSPLEGATVMTLSSASFSDGTLTLNFDEVSPSGEQGRLIEAGKPYIMKWSTTGNPIENPAFTAVTISSTAPTPVDCGVVTFRGIYNPVTLEANDRSILYLSTGNTLYYPSEAMTIGAFRAYFTIDSAIDTNLGDVNGDETINAIDITMLVDYILGKDPEGFIAANADVNIDDSIDIADVAALVNIILNGNTVIKEVVTNLDDLPVSFGRGSGPAQIRKNK